MGPIYGLNRYLYSAALRLYPFMEKAMEVNPEYKSGVESLRWLDVSGGFLPATSAAKLTPTVLPCIPLDLVSEAERGACCVGSSRPPYTFAQASTLEKSLQSRLHRWEHNMTRPIALSIIWQDRRMPTTTKRESNKMQGNFRTYWSFYKICIMFCFLNYLAVAKKLKTICQLKECQTWWSSSKVSSSISSG